MTIFSVEKVFGSGGKFAFNVIYKYDASRLDTEMRLDNDDLVVAKTAYEYGPAGKQSGCSL